MSSNDPPIDVPEPESREDKERELRKAADLLEQFEGDAGKLAMVAAQFWMAARGRTEREVWVTSGVAFDSGRGFVELTLGKAKAQLFPEQAREIGLHVLEAAEAAVSDEAIFRWGRALGSEQKAAHLVAAIRAAREERSSGEG